MNAPHLGRRAARRRRGAGGHRRGDRRRAGERLLRRAPAGPPRLPRPGDGLLLLQQRGRRRAPCAGAPRPEARGDRRLRRAPRQRHRRHPGRRRARADGRLLPAPVLSVQRHRPSGDQHGQPAGAGVHQGHGRARADRDDVDAAAGSLQARDDLRQRRLRRAPRRRPGPARPGRGTTTPGSPSASRTSPQRHAKGRIVSCLEGGYNLDALARSVEAHVRVLADL